MSRRGGTPDAAIRRPGTRFWRLQARRAREQRRRRVRRGLWREVLAGDRSLHRGHALGGAHQQPASERSYRGTLDAHCDDLDNRDPSYVGRDDVKRTLRRWPHPNTQRKNRAILVSFYDWAMEEGFADNPARQTRRPKSQAAEGLPAHARRGRGVPGGGHTVRERRIAHLGICAGVRNRELRGLQGRHFQRGLAVDQRRHRQGWPRALGAPPARAGAGRARDPGDR